MKTNKTKIRMQEDREKAKLDRQMKIAESIQEDCHKTVEYLIEQGSKASYQDLTNVYMFNKLALLQMEIEKLKGRTLLRKG